MKTELAAYQRIVELAKSINDNFPELGRRLRAAQELGGPLYDKALQVVGRRTAYYLIEIDRAFASLGVNRARLVAIGWTKLARLTKHVTVHNVDKLLALAEENTDRQLAALMAGEKPVENARTVLLSLKPKHYKLYATALLQHGAKASGRGLSGQEKALMAIIKKALKE